MATAAAESAAAATQGKRYGWRRNRPSEAEEAEAERQSAADLDTHPPPPPEQGSASAPSAGPTIVPQPHASARMLMGLDCPPAGEDSAMTHLSATNVQLNAPPTRRESAAAASDLELPKKRTETPDDTADIASSGLRPKPASDTRPQSMDVANCARDQQAASAPVVHPTRLSDGGREELREEEVSSPLPPPPVSLPCSLSIERTRKTARA